MTQTSWPPLVLRGRVVLPDAVLNDGVVVIRGPRLDFVGSASAAAAAGLDDLVDATPASRDYVLPGLIDLHNHGGGGVGFPDATSPDEAMTAVAEHRGHGTTTMLASLVSADPDTLVARTAMLAELAEAGEIAGIHAEGPFLSEARRGAHNPADLRAGDVDLVRRIVEAGRGHLASMTVAPEIDGITGPDGVARALVEAGAIASIGHTDGTADQAEALIAQVSAGLRWVAEREHAAGRTPRRREMTATHLFNGMRPLHHRSPGPIAACLAAAARGDLVVELIADGVHLDPATVRTAFGTVGADQVVLVTDAMAAAGMADGTYDLGPMRVEVAGGVARLAGPDGAIAGGTAHLIDVVRTSVAGGVGLTDAVRAASAVPARVLGLDGEIGRLRRGLRADILVTDENLHPLRVLRAGTDVPR